MKAALKDILNNLNYIGPRTDFDTLKQFINSLPNHNIKEEKNEVSNYVEFVPPPKIESNPLVNQNFIPNERQASNG